MKKAFVFKLGVIAAAPAVLVGCSGFEVGIDQDAKKAALMVPVFQETLKRRHTIGTASPFATSQEGTSSASSSIPSDYLSEFPTPTPAPAPAPEPAPAPVSQPVAVSFMCSDNQTASKGGINLRAATAVELKVRSPHSCVVADSPERNIRAKLINEKKIDITVIETACNLKFTNALTKTITFDVIGIKDGKSATLGTVTARSTNNQKWTTSGVSYILYDYNKKQVKSASHGELPPPSNQKQADQCDVRASPLVIRLNSDINRPSAIDLTAPLDGILFDILGRNSDPVPHTPKQISWFTQDSMFNHYFLVKPNRYGEVNGIDELFGDNTLGPDGKFAANGYEALRKYDGRRSDGSYSANAIDGFITPKDEIYRELRLWRDENLDGVAQKWELFTLSEKGIVAIDLNYDPNFVEVDQYGNETRMKSVVQTNDGRLHLIFDLWFRYL